MALKKIRRNTSTPDSPEQLFNDLKNRVYPAMLSYQADVTRKYCDEALDSADVALQLPTGSGKTLVGLMIGEWRRRKFEERILYVCPTNQLVHQVVNEAANKYGLQVTAFTGSKSQYSASDKRAYKSAETIAVTSYSSLFNTAPYFENPEVIILDDAHSSENYIAEFWTLRILRFLDGHESLFDALAALLKPLIQMTSYQKMVGIQEDAWTRGWVDKLPTPHFLEITPDLINIIDTHLQGEDLDIWYSWSVIRNNLHACHLYIAAYEIVIRPLIPPTFSHPPFQNAKQRIYMSATLGSGGDLERLTGRKKIQRLAVPSGWDTQGIGRRFFLFPNQENQENQALVLSLMKNAGRSLVLVPHEGLANTVREQVEKEIKFKTFNARDIETTKSPFIESAQAVTIVANRYDGIDFPQDECRLLIAQGLPKATNLQEKFIMSRMGAITLLNDRILTRVIQAIGRCTRSPTDYSAVVILGDELLDYFLDKNRRRYLHPELQAEIFFGQEQSKEATTEDYLENFDIFLQHDKEWAEGGDDEILSLRNEMSQLALPGTDDLRSSVEHEVKYQVHLWNGSFPNALEACRAVLGKIQDPSLQGYRALWNYLAGSVTFMGHASGVDGYQLLFKDYYTQASKGAPTLPWLNALSSFQQELDPQENDDDTQALIIIERMERVLEQLGVRHDRKFEAKERIILDGLVSEKSTEFETAHVELGHLLGYEAGNSETNGAPDPWWQVDDKLCFAFEDHSSAKATSQLSVDKARQAHTHPNWLRSKLELQENATIIRILVTPVRKADEGAVPHLKNVYYWALSDFQDWAKNALSVIRESRKTFSGAANVVWRAEALDQYKLHELTPAALINKVQDSIASDILE
ncbi:DEAD/DEAH box helicase [Leptothoe sp. PORK10 BA2]|uniref:DEAD/DEAH box helicase n=1 Tax=Leptothoe sp. PORK10 BA2 TaxID=3110254 RepID=UPI002B211487|nr:DEAD/DEAH box helicase [Leptothoe sp. PORK10 BA2]MEA5462861.1 DEAD/DEAH box helicase [Leptothoe sp. PORK10 BA2]